MSDPETIAVYLYETYDRATRSWKQAASYATEAAIAAREGVIIHSSMMQVAADRVGEDGLLRIAEGEISPSR